MEERQTHLLWGTYTWILFHWIAEQIKDEYFVSEREPLLLFIQSILSNLPCPNCREHASQYLAHSPLSLIKTKDDMKNYIYHFHNAVNIRSKKQFQSHSILEKYKTINFRLLIDSWNHHFSYNNDIQRHDFMAKKRINTLKKELNDYFSLNAHKFLMS